MPGQGGFSLDSSCSISGSPSASGWGVASPANSTCSARPTYMAPEQALGKTASVVSGGTVRAGGDCVFENAVRQTPFSGTDIMEVLQKVVDPRPPSIDASRRTCRASVSAV